MYGVTVPFNEGKIGMACVVFKPEITINTALWNEFFYHLQKHLPPYSQPFFIRVTTEIQRTSTFKYTKTELINQGFNITKVRNKKKLNKSRNICI